MKYYFDSVSKLLDVIVVSRNNNDDDAIVIMSIKEYNALMETEHLFSSSLNRKRLEESIHQLKNDETVSYSLDD